MKKINLKGISEILSEKELKNVMGGSTYKCYCNGQWATVTAASIVYASQMNAYGCNSSNVGGCYST